MGRKEELLREPGRQEGNQEKEVFLKLRKAEILRKKGSKLSVQPYKYLFCCFSMPNAVLDCRTTNINKLSFLAGRS